MIHDSHEKGLAIVLALFILSGVLALALGASTLMLRDLRLGRTAGFSAIAFFGADAGIEKILTLRNDPMSFTLCITEATSCTLPNGTVYWIERTPGGVGSCPAVNNFCIKSTGVYMGTRRAIEVNY